MQIIKECSDTRYGIIGSGTLFFEHPFLSFAEPDTPETRALMETLFEGISSGNYNIGVGGKKNELAPLVVTAEEAANMLRISKPKMYNLTRRDDFPTLRIGSKVLIPIEKLKEWVNTHSLADEELIGA